MINFESFDKRYRQLLYITYQKGSEPSFTSGLWNEEEGYKREFWKEARESLLLDTWSSISPKEILSLATKPFGTLMSGSYRNQNLVSYENYSKLFEIFLDKETESAQALMDIFFGHDDEAAFNRFAKLLSRKSMNDPLSIVSLFFFLKDKDKYVTARKQGTGERLNKLGISAACVQGCTWSGYQTYLNIVKTLQKWLKEKGLHASLLDAQSFLWMLWMVGQDTPEYDDRDFHDYAEGVVNISKAQWEEMIREGFLTDKDITYLTKFYAAPNHASTLTRLAEIERIDSSAYISPCVSIGKRVAEKYHIPSIPREENPDTEKIYPIVFLGRRLRDGHFEWKLRPELVEALEVTSSQALASELINREQLEEQEAETLPYDELIARAASYHGGTAPVFTSMTKQRKRNGLLVAAAKARAGGKCQLCGITPFLTRTGKPYLEAHHVIPLAEGGADELSNMVALCPNCHRKMHVVCDLDDVAKLMALAEIG